MSGDRMHAVGRALGWGVMARVVRFLLGIWGSVIVVGGLGAHDYGVLAVLRNLLSFVAVAAGGGLTQGLLRYIPAWRVEGGRARILRAVLSTLGLQVLFWALLLLALWATRVAWTPWSGAAAGLLLLGVLLVLPEVVSNTATQVAHAHYDARSLSGALVASSLVYVGLVLWLFDRGEGIRGVLLAAAGSNAVLAALLLARLPRYLGRIVPGAESAGGVSFRRLVGYSTPFLAIGLLNLITWRQSEVLFLGHFRSAEEAGFFDLGYRLPQTVLEFVPGAIWPLVMAGFSEVYTRDPDALQRTADAYYKLLFFLVGPLSVGGVLVGDLAVHVLYGPEYAASGVLCQVFFLVFSVSFLSTPLSMVLYVVERPGAGLLIYLANALVNVGLDLLLIPRFGIWGALVPVSLVVLLSPFPYRYMLRRLGIGISIPWGFLGRVYAASALMLLVIPLRFREPGWPVLLVMVGAGAALFLVGMRLFRVVGPAEAALFRRASPRAWNRLRPLLAGRGEAP